jgi:hypothetical protein
MNYISYGRAANQTVFRSNTPLSNDQIARYAPSVFATEAHESRGERYSFIPTIDVLQGLSNEGFLPYEVRQTRVRDQSKREHTKHLIRLRHANHGTLVAGSEIPEICLINSHDGTSSYQLIGGVFRVVCSNGLIAGNIADDIRIRHSGNVVGDVIEGSYRVLDNLKEIESRVDTYKAINLDVREQLALANAAIDLRWDRDEVSQKAPVQADSLLAVHRWDDRKADLWTTFNVIQENLIKGGVRARTSTGKRTHTRAVGGVNENVKLNRALWSLADALAEHKLAA